jgi:N-acetylated-alpha-linked acidic dipeptidase
MRSVIALAGTALLAAQPALAGDAWIRGFTADGAAAEHAREAGYIAAISEDRISAYHLKLTAEPHRATSPRNNELAGWIADQWRSQGWDQVTFRKYQAWFTTPKSISLEMLAPKPFKASLREDAIPVDPSSQRADLPGAFNAYSASGDVTAEVVYAHGGNPDDFALLARQGVQVKGRIVVVRYSYPYSFRGFKVMNAEKAGAAGVIIYSDPAEEGAARGKVFPDGPWGPESHLQRGFTAYAPIAPGDPTTPGWASVAGARHLDARDSPTLPKIPVLAISARDARPLLENMTGPEAPRDWRGGLPITYRLGGGVKAHLKVEMDAGLRTFTDVEARIEGSEHPEEIVLLGNHRDAWVFGATDPSSGTASFLELTRALGEMRKAGWRPKRTLVICSWDGEEEGLIGSTEWAEQYAAEMQKNLVAYLNVDMSISGAVDPETGKLGAHLGPYVSGSMIPMLIEASKDVPAPEGGSLYDVWRKTRAEELGGPATDSTMVEAGLDASSDHTAFVLHLGRPVIGLTYGGAYGVYHSVYDDRYYMEHFGDPGFRYSAAISRFWGVLGLRLAEADIVPASDVPYAELVSAQIDLLAKAAGSDLDFSGLRRSNAAFMAAAAATDLRTVRLLAEDTDPSAIHDLSRRLMAAESGWLDPDGLPGRPWTRHLLYGMKLNFLPLNTPGLTEAIERRDWPGARVQMAKLKAALDGNTDLLLGSTAP